MRLIAHRGLHGPPPAAPENTLPALAAAIADPGLAGLECDIRLLGDGTPVIFHDADTDRLTGRHLRLADLAAPGWATLTAHDGTPLPTLASALPLFQRALQRPDFELHVEIKPHPRLEPALTHLRAAVASLIAAPTPGRLIISSFDPRFLAALAALRPALAVALIVHQPAGLDALAFLPGPPVDVHADDALLLARPDLLARWHAEGHTTRLWTIDDPARAAALASLPAGLRPAALITNRPELLRESIAHTEPFAPRPL